MSLRNTPLFRSMIFIAVGLFLVIALAAPARAETLTLVCSRPTYPIVSTFFIDLSAQTVTTTANSLHGEMVTWRAQITDKTIQYYTRNGDLIGTFDRC